MTNTPPTGTVTFLLTDIEGSTQMWERNPAVMKEALGWHDRVVREAIERNGGYVFSTAGDSFAAAFGDPMQGAAAAVQIQGEISAREWEELGPLKVRMGLDAGIAEERDGDYFGPPVNRAARIMSLARGGEVLTSHTAADLLRHHLEEGIRLQHLGERELKGMSLPETVFAVEYGPSREPERTRRPSRGLAWAAVAGIAVVIAIAVGILVASGDDEPAAPTAAPSPTTPPPLPTSAPTTSVRDDTGVGEEPDPNPIVTPVFGPEALTTWVVRPLNDGGEAGARPALAAGANGEKFVVFESPAAGDLRAVICRDQSCRRVARVRIADGGSSPAAAVGADGLPVVAYVDLESGALQVAHCEEATCSEVTTATVADGPVGGGPALAIGRDRRPVLAYFDEAATALLVTHCGTADCTTATTFVLDDAGDVGSGAAIAVGDDGAPIISYLDRDNNTLKVAHCDTVNCSQATITTVDMSEDPGVETALTVAGDTPYIAYRASGSVVLVACRDVLCSRAETTVIDRVPGGPGAAVGFGTGDVPLVAYHSSADGLKLARCGDVACSTVTVYGVDTIPTAGVDAAMAVLPSGLPLLAYGDEADAVIRLALPEAAGG